MKKLLSISLCLCMLIGWALSTSAISSNVLIKETLPIESTAENSINIITKDMVTGEVEYSAVCYQPKATLYADGTIGKIQPGWFPSTETFALEDNNEVTAPYMDNSISMLNDENRPDPRGDGVIGNDDREIISNTKEYPYSAICYLETVWPNSTTTIGTTWMFGSKVAATAGHNLYSSDRGGWADNVTIWPGKKGNGLFSNHFGKAQKVSMMADPYVNNDQSFDYDWGMIELDKSLGDKTGWFGYSWIQNDIEECVLTISGYPSDHQYYQLKMSGPVVNVTTTQFRFYMDATSGQSGSPLYTSNYSVYGIFVATQSSKYGDEEINVASRINAEVYYYLSHFLN